MTCDMAAVGRYTWPGKPEAYVCAAHMNKLHAVAAAVGVNLCIIPLRFEEMEGKTCPQELGHGYEWDQSY